MKYKILILIMCISLNISACQVVECPEDIYLKNACNGMVKRVNKSAEKMGFAGSYHVVFPKKAGIDVNPANKFIAGGINPTNNFPLLVVNPDWFFTLPENQQEAYLDVNLSKFVLGHQHAWAKYIILVHGFLSWLLIFAIYFLLRRFGFMQKNWQRFLLSLGIVFVFNFLFAVKIQAYINDILATNHNLAIYRNAIAKGADKDAIISNLESFEALVKEELRCGQLFWKPIEGKFAGYAKELKKN